MANKAHRRNSAAKAWKEMAPLEKQHRSQRSLTNVGKPLERTVSAAWDAKVSKLLGHSAKERSHIDSNRSLDDYVESEELSEDSTFEGGKAKLSKSFTAISTSGFDVIKEPEKQSRSLEEHLVDWSFSCYESICCVFAFIYLCIVPYCICFEEFNQNKGMLFIIVDMFWIFDVLFLYFWAGSPINRSKRHSTKEVAFQEYVESHLLHDILGAIPYEVIMFCIYGFSNEVPGISFLLFSFKFPFLIRRLLRMRIVVNSSIAMQFLEVMVVITWLTHYLTCVGFLISRDSTPFGDRNATNANVANGNVSWAEWLTEDYNEPIDRYLHFWYLVSVAAQGENINPNNSKEALFSLFMSIFGAAMMATIFGYMFVLVDRFNMKSQYYYKKMAELEATTNILRLPKPLRKDIKSYYEYFLDRYGFFDFDDFKRDLPPPMAEKISFHQHGQALRNLELFDGVTDEFVQGFANMMRMDIYSPGDDIVKEGDEGSEMFLIYQGRVQILVKRDGKQVQVHSQGEGTIFGEFSLLYRNIKRTATVRAVTFCDIFVMDKTSLVEVVKRYPDCSDVMIENAARLMSQKLSQSEHKNIARMSMSVKNHADQYEQESFDNLGDRVLLISDRLNLLYNDVKLNNTMTGILLDKFKDELTEEQKIRLSLIQKQRGTIEKAVRKRESILHLKHDEIPLQDEYMKEGYSHFQTLTIPGIENGREDVISAWQCFYDTDDDEEVLDQNFGGARADYDSSGEDNDAEKIGSHVPPTPPSEVDGPPSAAEASFSGSEF